MNTFCNYYNANTCRSCTYLEREYSSQITLKEQVLKASLSLEDGKLQPTVCSKVQGFRNKAKLAVTGTMENPIIGLVGEDELDLGREILDCALHHPAINQILPDIARFITSTRLAPYQIQERKGELKGIILFYSEASGEMYLRFILRSKESLDRFPKNLSALMSKNPHLKCLSANIQPIPHALLEGEEEIFFTPQHYVHHQISDLRLQLDPRGFVQTNEEIAAKLYQSAAHWIKEIMPEKFCELYSGQGAFSFLAAKYFKLGLGIEINADAVASANQTAIERNLTHLSFKAADAAFVEKELYKFAPDLLLVNPPRRGLGPSLDYLQHGKFDYILYSSCSHESLATDLKVLGKHYQVEKAQIFDMFPHTTHFETLVLLKKI